MSKLTILLIFLCFMELMYSRPVETGSENESMEEMEYEDTKEAADPEPEPESRVKLKGFSENDDTKTNRRYLLNNNYMTRLHDKERSDQMKPDISEYKHARKDIADENNAKTIDYENFGEYSRDLSKYSQNNEEVDNQRVHNRNINFGQSPLHNTLLSDNPSEKKANDMKVNDEGDNLFEYKKDEPGKIDKGDTNNEPLVMNADYSKQFLNQIRLQNRPFIENKQRDFAHLYLSRDRRETEKKESQPSQENSAPTVDEPKDNPTKLKESDEEITIKNHLKKLTDEELQELLNSLSEDKRALLKKIIADNDITDNDGINKREITKKAQAVEGNSFSENGQSDVSTIDGGSVTLTEASSPNAETTEASKQSEKPEVMENVNTKTTEPNTNAALQSQVDSLEKKSDASNTNNEAKLNDKSEIVRSESATAKNENKREVNVANLADETYEDSKPIEENILSKESESNQEYRCNSDQLNQFLDDDKAEITEDSHINRRDTDTQQEFDSKYKSLEESFPSSDAYDESPGPLIRVKRKNLDSIMKKRSAGGIPDAKTAYLSYKTENDEDADEGNEFDEDGFYDRNPSYCSSESRNVINDKLREAKNIPAGAKHESNINEVNKDTNSLGTDTDSVLSGVEGVDENLMFNSRNRRTANDNQEDSDSLQNIDSKSNNENNVRNEPNYQENDAFGALPRNYEGDLGRYKRIRRVKQSHTDGTISNT